MRYGYADNNVDKLDVDVMYYDEVSATNRQRQNLQQLINTLKDSDVLVVPNLCHLGFGVHSIVEKMSIILSKNVNIISDNVCVDKSYMYLINALLKSKAHALNIIKRKTNCQGKKGRCRKTIDEVAWKAYHQLWSNGLISKKNWHTEMGIPSARFYSIFRERFKS
jgi:DNA invertase Pin-like site-specific DNA recombinase